MTAATLENGLKLATLQDLLANLQGQVPKERLSSFRTTVDHLSRCLQVPTEQLTIDALVDVAPAFTAYLQERRYKPNSIRSYSKFAAMLLRKAKQLGWEPKEPEVPQAWQPILAAVTKAGCKDIVHYATRHRIEPCDFTDRDLDAWGETMLVRQRTHYTILYLKRTFRRVVWNSGLGEALPGLSRLPKSRRYGIPLRSFPPQLQAEVIDLLKWKQALFAPNRPKRCRNRPVTAALLQNTIERLYGFVTRVLPTLAGMGPTQNPQRDQIQSLVDMVTQEVLNSFVDWSINERKILSGSVKVDLRMLYSAVRHYFKGHNFSWLGELLNQITEDPRSGVEDRKVLKFLDYDVVANIPNKIRDERQKLEGGPAKRIAISVRDELLMLWLTILPWRQRNLREFRLEVNLFKRELPPLGSIETPQWVQERIKLNHTETFWQVHFREDETKNGERIRTILPRQLVPLLEEYLNYHRPILVTGRDPGNLFLNTHGQPLDSEALRDLVGDLTQRYVHKRVTPHLFRDIFALKWLKKYPTDYLTVSKHLWHKDLKTTLRCYGSRFDTSVAVCRVEEWLDQREQSASIR